MKFTEANSQGLSIKKTRIKIFHIREHSFTNKVDKL